jgi:hypothetical protein
MKYKWEKPQPFEIPHDSVLTQSTQWFTPVILATQEAEIRRIIVQSQPRQIVQESLSQKDPKRAGGVAQGVGPEFRPQYCKKKKKKKEK